MVGDSYLHQKAESVPAKEEQYLLQVCVTLTSWDPQSLLLCPCSRHPDPHASKLIHNEVMEPCWTGVSILKNGDEVDSSGSPSESTKADRLMGIMADWVGLRTNMGSTFQITLPAWMPTNFPMALTKIRTLLPNLSQIIPKSKHRFPCGLAELIWVKVPNMSELPVYLSIWG